MNILVQICSNHEWRATKEIIGAKNISESPYGEYFTGQVDGQEVLFFHSGVTKTRSAAACQYAISNWNPKVMFCFGTCGSVSSELKPLDLILAKTTAQYDCIDRMEGVESPFFYEEMITEMDLSWLNIQKLSIPMKIGFIATADQDLSMDLLSVLRSHSVLAVDWESGAIAKVCELNRVRCCMVRGVTDTVIGLDSTTISEQKNHYQTNTPLVMEKCLKLLLPELMKQL